MTLRSEECGSTTELARDGGKIVEGDEEPEMGAYVV